MKLYPLILTFFALNLFSATANTNPVDNIQVKTPQNVPIKLERDDPVGITTRPLRKMKERWDNQYHDNFLQYRKISVEYGQPVSGSIRLAADSIRLTIYQISRKFSDDDFSLRVLLTGVYDRNEIATVDTTIDKLKNNFYIITAEQINNHKQLNSHLTYMKKQDNSIELKGYSTNWSLSKLRLKLSGVSDTANADTFTKDADWLVGQLINPQWVIFVRADKNT
jgi:hypothetical protein